MATLKHIASKNSDYTAIEAYLVYQHDEFTGKQLLDEHGRPKLRESYILDTLECGDFSFATACLQANRKYGKNTQRDDIKSHQYIISFDPRDAADNGLTMDKAQALGLKFCSENFPGHPAIVCTHPDGHNHSGNIHVHIVIGSIRTREVERKPYMQKPRDWRGGMKHSSTAQTNVVEHLHLLVAVSLPDNASIALSHIAGFPANIQMMNCHKPVLHVGTRAHFCGTAQQNPHIAGAHFGEQHRFFCLGVRRMDKCHLVFRHTRSQQFCFDVIIDIELPIIFRCRKITEQQLCQLLFLMRHLRVEVMEMCEGAGLYQIDLLNGSKERVSEAEYWARRRGQMKLDRENAALAAAGQQPKQKKFETVKDILRKTISSVLYRATSFEEFSDRLMQQYGITVKESRGQLSYLPSGRTKFTRAKHLGDNFDKAAVLAALTANAERKRTVTLKHDRIGKLIDIQAKLAEGKGVGYEHWAKKFNLKAMAQTLLLLQEKGLTDEDALNQRIEGLSNKFHESSDVAKDLEVRMKANKELRYHVAVYTNTKGIAQQLKTTKQPAAFENQHRAELTQYRAAAAYFKANSITKLPSLKKLEAEYEQLASEKAKFYEQYKEAKEELLKLQTARQNVASYFREEKQMQQER